MNKMEPGLYIVSTPIGNIKDITLRAIETLQNSDFIACEDTRVSKKLMSVYKINSPMILYHEHNAPKVRHIIINKLKENKVISLISDAGTPLVSDPGYKLLKEAISNNLYVTVIPGVSSVISSITLSGLPTDRFMFIGFLPSKKNARKKYLEDLLYVDCSIVFFESSKRIIKSLNDIFDILGNRYIAVCRELTKKFEDVLRGNLSDILDNVNNLLLPKGEFTVVIEGFSGVTFTTEELDKAIINSMKEERYLKNTVDIVAKKFKISKRKVYQRALIFEKKES